MNARVVTGAVVFLAVLACTVNVAFGSHDTLSVLLPGNALEGSRLFADKACLTCHSVHGVGGTAGPDLGRGTLNRPLFDIAAVMWNHAPGMEHLFQERRLRRPTFEPAEMASLLAFLYYLGSLDVPGDADRGAVAFREKGCQGCHPIGGTARGIGPNLGQYSRYVSPLFLTTGLWNHGKFMATAMEARKVNRPVFQGTDIPDLLAYVRSVGGSAERVYAVPGSPKRGEALFTGKHCAECHAVRGHGPAIGPDLAIALKGSLIQIAGAMWNHGPRMWRTMAERGIEVPQLTTEEMADLVSYLYFFQFIDPPGDRRRGAAVYADRRCGSCHGAVGSKVTAPTFPAIAAQLKTPVAVMTAMWNHAGRMTEMMAEENVAWPLLKGGEMADLIAYLLGTPMGPDAAPTSGASAASAARRPAKTTK